MKIRTVICSIDCLMEVMRGYLGEDQLPADAKALTLRVNPQEKGRLALEIESPSISGDPMIEVKFDLRRYV